MNFLQSEFSQSTDPVLLFTGKCAVWDAECHIRETGKDLEAVGQDIAGAAEAAAEELRLKEFAQEAARISEEIGLDDFIEDVGDTFEEVAEVAVQELEKVAEKSLEIANTVKDAVESEAEALWSDLKAAFGDRSEYYTRWRNRLASDYALKVDGQVYTSVEDEVKAPTKTTTSRKVELELTRIKPIIDILNEELLTHNPNRSSGIKGIPGFGGIPVPSFGKKLINTWKLSCPEDHILVPKLSGDFVKDPSGYYEESDKFYNIHNECGTSFKVPDEQRSILGKASQGTIEGIKTGADLAGLTTLVFSDGTKQCCRQHRMCQLGYSDAMEGEWVQGKRVIDGSVCEQEYWECLGACAMFGSMQSEIAGIFGIDSLKGGCPSESDVSESGGMEKTWGDSAAKGGRWVAKKAGKRYVKNKVLQKTGGKAYLKLLKDYKKAKKAGKDVSKFSKKALKVGKAVKFVKKAFSVLPKLVKEVGVAPALAFSSFETSASIPANEHWMCIPNPIPLPEEAVHEFTKEELGMTDPCHKWPKSTGGQDGVNFGDQLGSKAWLTPTQGIRHKEGCSLFAAEKGATFFQKVGNNCVVYDEVRNLSQSEYKKSYPKFTSHAGGQVGGPLSSKSWHTPTSNSFLSQSTNESIRHKEGCALFAAQKGAKYFQLSGGKCHVYAEVGKGGKYGTGWNNYISTTSGTRDSNLSKQRCKDLSYGKVDGIQIVNQSGNITRTGRARVHNWGSVLPQGCLKRYGSYGHVYWNSGTGGRCNAYKGAYPCIKEVKSTACGGDCWKLTGGYEMKTQSLSGPCTGGYCWKIDKDNYEHGESCLLAKSVEGNFDKSVTSDDCKVYADRNELQFTGGYSNSNMVKGCQIWNGNEVYFNITGRTNCNHRNEGECIKFV